MAALQAITRIANAEMPIRIRSTSASHCGSKAAATPSIGAST